MAWRYHPGSRDFEIFCEGGGNVFGLEFDGDGRLFSGHNGGDTRGWHYVQDGYCLKQGRHPGKYGPPSYPYAFGDLPMMRGGKIPRFSHNVILCEGTGLPPRLEGGFLGADPLHNYLVLSVRKRRGATFETEDVGFPLRSSEKGFRPVYLTNAPDGSVYVADFYEEFIAHGQHYQSQIDPSSGRVYRLRAKNAELEKDVDLRSKSSAELVALLDHPNKWHRQTAVRLLRERRATEAKAELERWIREHDDRAALDGLWALHGVSGVDDELALELLEHPYPPVRAWVVRILGDRRQLPAAFADQLTNLVASEVAVEVRSQVASTAQRLPADQALPLVRALLEREEDAGDPYLPLLSWWALEKKCDSDRDRVLAFFDEPTFWDRPTVREHILPRLMRRFALQGRRIDLLACARLLRVAPAERHRARLMAGFERAFEGRSLAGLPDELLEVLAETGGLSLALRLRRGDAQAIEDALEVVSDAKAKLDERLLYARAFGEVDAPSSVGPLLDVAAGAGDARLRRTALASLQRYDDRRIGRRVLEMYGALPDDVRPAAQALLASRATWSLLLLRAVDSKTISVEEITADTVDKIRGHRNEAIETLAARLLGAAKPTSREALRRRAEEVREIIRGGAGSPYRGEPLFLELCGNCHRLFHKGGQVGPDLTSYQRADLETTVASVVDPNAEIREGYENHVIVTTDGRIVSGFIADEDPRVVVVRGSDGNDLAIPREKILQARPAGRSLMPEGLLDGLGEAELRDLFAYLRISQPISP